MENYHSISSKSSLSPTKFEKFVKMDQVAISNPFRAKRTETVKHHIKNSQIYQARAANAPKIVTENVD